MPNKRIVRCPACGNDTFIEGVFRTLLPTQVTQEVSVIGISVDQFDNKEMYAIRTKICTECGFTIPYVPLQPQQIGLFVPKQAEVLDHKSFEVYFTQPLSNIVEEAFSVDVTPSPTFDIARNGIRIDPFNRNRLVFTTTADILKEHTIHLKYIGIQSNPMYSDTIMNDDKKPLVLSDIPSYLVQNVLGGNYIDMTSSYAEGDGVTIHVFLDENIPLTLSAIQKSNFKFSKNQSTDISGYKGFMRIEPKVTGIVPYTNEIIFTLYTDDALTYYDTTAAIVYTRPSDYTNDIKSKDGMIMTDCRTIIKVTGVPDTQRRKVQIDVDNITSNTAIIDTSLDEDTINYVKNVQITTTSFDEKYENVPFTKLSHDRQLKPGYYQIEVLNLQPNLLYSFRLEMDQDLTKLYEHYSNIASRVTAQPNTPKLNKLAIKPDPSDVNYSKWSVWLSWAGMDEDFVSAKLMVKVPGSYNFVDLGYAILPPTPNTYRYDGMVTGSIYDFKIVETGADGKTKDSNILSVVATVYNVSLTAAEKSPTQAHLNWSSNDSRFINFVTDVYYKLDTATSYSQLTLKSLVDVNSYDVRELVAKRIYTFKVITHNNNGDYGISNEASVNLLTYTPKLYIANTDVDNEFLLTWDMITGFEEAYIKYKRIDRLAPVSETDYDKTSIVQNIGEYTPNYRVKIPRGQAWKMILQVVGGINDGNSNEVQAMASVLYSVDLTQLSISSNSASLQAVSTDFNIGNSSECQYMIEISEDGGNTFTQLTPGTPAMANVSPMTTVFDKYTSGQYYAPIVLNTSGDGISSVSVNSIPLTLNNQYTASGSNITIPVSYLAGLNTGVQNITVTFDNGTPIVVKNIVVDNTPVTPVTPSLRDFILNIDSITDNTVKVSWDSSHIKIFILAMNGEGNNYLKTSDTATSPFTFDGLTAGCKYKISYTVYWDDSAPFVEGYKEVTTTNSGSSSNNSITITKVTYTKDAYYPYVTVEWITTNPDQVKNTNLELDNVTNNTNISNKTNYSSNSCKFTLQNYTSKYRVIISVAWNDTTSAVKTVDIDPSTATFEGGGNTGGVTDGTIVRLTLGSQQSDGMYKETVTVSNLGNGFHDVQYFVRNPSSNPWDFTYNDPNVLPGQSSGFPSVTDTNLKFDEIAVAHYVNPTDKTNLRTYKELFNPYSTNTTDYYAVSNMLHGTSGSQYQCPVSITVSQQPDSNNNSKVTVTVNDAEVCTKWLKGMIIYGRNISKDSSFHPTQFVNTQDYIDSYRTSQSFSTTGLQTDTVHYRCLQNGDWTWGPTYTKGADAGYDFIVELDFDRDTPADVIAKYGIQKYVTSNSDDMYLNVSNIIRIPRAEWGWK